MRFTNYIETLKNRLDVNVEYSSLLDSYCLRIEKFNAFVSGMPTMMKYRYHYFLKNAANISTKEVNQFFDQCYASVASTPHSKMVNMVAIPMICQEVLSNEVKAALVKPIQTNMNGEILYPVAIELSTGTIYYPQKTPFQGFAVWPALKKVIAATMYYYA